MRFVLLLFLNLFDLQIKVLAELCFVLRTSTVRRDAVAVAPAISKKGCNIRCVGTPGCEACMHYADRATCVMLGPARSPLPGACPVPYAVYEKQFSACPVSTPPPVDRGYTPGPCSPTKDLREPPVPGRKYACARQSGTIRKIVLDAILHDGTRQIYANDEDSSVEWDQNVGSWYYSLKGQRFYFKSATCVRPPEIPQMPSCDCGTISTAQPLPPGRTRHPSLKPANGTAPICQGSSALVYLKQTITGGGANKDQDVVPPTVNDIVYCAMGEWMILLDRPGYYGEALLRAVTCLL